MMRSSEESLPRTDQRPNMVATFWHSTQGRPERTQRVLCMVQAWDHEGFGNCTMHRECEAVCPKEIGVNFIGRMNRESLLTALLD